MTSTILRATAAAFLAATVALAGADGPLSAQTAAPKPQTKPAPRRGSPPPAAQKPAPPPQRPAPPPAEDVRFKTIYTTGDQRTESLTYVKGLRERFEFQDMVLLRQHDLKRVVQISRAANTYLVAPVDSAAPAAVPAADPAAPPKPPGVVAVTTTIVDTGERKNAFGREARHVKTIIERQPSAGACDPSKQRIETDGWYIDGPKVLTTQSGSSPSAAAASSCHDQVTATYNGDPKALGFPVGYTSTIAGEDGKPSVVSMEVSEFELTTLDPALFEIPQGLNAAMNIGELGKALSDANEAKLAAAHVNAPASPPARTPGVIRIGVPELTNKTTTPVDTRALRADLVEALTESKFEAVPMSAAPPAELQTRAAEQGIDYLVLAEVSELKVSKGGFGGLMRAASKVTAGGSAPQKDPTESSVAVKLVQPDGKQRLSTTAKGKDGSGFSLKTGLSIARFAGGMYMSMFMGPQMMSRMYRFNALSGGNMGGFGMLGNPALFQMQSMGMGVAGGGRGLAIDQTAGAASFIMQQAMAMNGAVNMGTPGGPSFAESLGEALDNSAKAVAKALEKK
jgi:hypothetical protein